MNENVSPRNSKGQRHGYWVGYYGSVRLYYKGHYKNDKCVGLWEWYSIDGSLWVKEYYNHLVNREGISIKEINDG